MMHPHLMIMITFGLELRNSAENLFCPALHLINNLQNFRRRDTVVSSFVHNYIT